jgi:hypothetical protein
MKTLSEDEKARKRTERFTKRRESLLRAIQKDRELLRKIVAKKAEAKS